MRYSFKEDMKAIHRSGQEDPDFYLAAVAAILALILFALIGGKITYEIFMYFWS